MQAISNAPDLSFSADVRAFCEDHGIIEHLRLALRLATETFELDGDPRLTVETDPETDEESVAIDVLSHMSCDEALDRERQFTLQWVQSVPAPVLGMIRLILNIA